VSETFVTVASFRVKVNGRFACRRSNDYGDRRPALRPRLRRGLSFASPAPDQALDCMRDELVVPHGTASVL
jgi:hypothetical protein